MGDESGSDEGSLSPIFGLSDEYGNDNSIRWRIDTKLSPLKPSNDHDSFLPKAGKAVKRKFEEDEEDLTVLAGSHKVAKPKLEQATSEGFVGFTTAGGKAIKVSEEALEAARKKFETEDEEGMISSGVNKVAKPSKKEFVGFTTAGGKAVSISEKALAAAKKKFEAEDKDMDCMTSSGTNKVDNPRKKQFVGFTTAGGKAVSISEKALAAAKKKFETDDEECMISSGVNEVAKPSKKEFVGFTTAGGKAIKVSEEALKAARMKFETENEDCMISSDVNNVDKPNNNEFVGFTTAGGKAISISEKALAAAKQKFEMEDEECPNSSPKYPSAKSDQSTVKGIVGFSTASGKTIKISDKALEAAKKKFDIEFNDNEVLSGSQKFAKPNNKEFVGFATAGGKAIKVSEEALEAAKKKFQMEDEEYPNSSPKFPSVKSDQSTFKGIVGFSTASGNKIKISDEALEAAKKKFDIVGDDNEVPSGSQKFAKPNNKEFVGFATAGGKAIKVSEEALEAAKKKFQMEDEEYPNSSPKIPSVRSDQSTFKGIVGFSTAGGKTIKISEEALEAAKKKFDIVDDDYEVLSGSQKVDKSSFSQSNSNEYAANESANAKEKQDMEEENDSILEISPKVPDFPLSPEQLDDLTLSLLEDASISDGVWGVGVDEYDGTNTRCLATLESNGGIAPVLTLVVVRAYSVVYCLKKPGSTVFVSEKAYLQSQKVKENKIEELREKLLPEIEQKIRKGYCGKKFTRMTKKTIEDMSADDLVIYLNSEEDSTSYIMSLLSLSRKKELEEARIKLEDKIRAEVHEEFSNHLKSSELESRASPVLKLRVLDMESYQKEECVKHNGVISIWFPKEEMLHELKEHQMFEFHGLKTSSYQSSLEIRLSTTKESRIHPKGSPPLNDYFARKLSMIAEVLSEGFTPPFGEFDTVGVVDEVTAYTKAEGQIVYLADKWGNTLKLKFWGSLEDAGLQDLLKVGAVVACENLQWRLSSFKSGMAFAQDVSCFHTNTKLEHLVNAFQDLSKFLAQGLG